MIRRSKRTVETREGTGNDQKTKKFSKWFAGTAVVAALMLPSCADNKDIENYIPIPPAPDSGAATESDTGNAKGTDGATDATSSDVNTDSGMDSDTENGSADSDVDADADSDSETGTITDTGTGMDSETDSETESGTGTDSETGTSTDTGTETDTSTETDSDTTTDTGTDTGTETEDDGGIELDGGLNDGGPIGSACEGAGEGEWDGIINLETPAEAGGYRFEYLGDLSGGNPVFNIRCSANNELVAEEAAFQEHGEATLAIPADNVQITVDCSAASSWSANVTINVESTL